MWSQLTLIQQRATTEGFPVHGQFLWSLIENFKRIAGYNDRYGVYHVDFETR